MLAFASRRLWLALTFSLIATFTGCKFTAEPSTEAAPSQAMQEEARSPANQADDAGSISSNRVCTVDSFRQPNAPVVKKLDVLFVMDSSHSMRRHWELIANQIDRLIRNYPKGQDVRYAVITGNMEVSPGAIYAPRGTPQVIDGTKLTAAQVSSHLRRTFVSALNVPDHIGVGEGLFYSLHHAVTARAKDNQRLGFFRPDAALHVIMMSDDAEIGTPYPTRQPWGLPPKCNYIHHESVRKSHYLPRGITTNTTWQAIRRLKGSYPVSADAFVNITKEDILVDNKLTDKCIYDSPGYGYFDMVKLANGVLYSIHRGKAAGLEQMAKSMSARMNLIHDFKLSKPAEKVDSATIEAKVDGTRKAHTYNPLTNMVNLRDAGQHGSRIEIRHCEPVTRKEWSISGFSGVAGQREAALRWDTVEYATEGRLIFGTEDGRLDRAVSSRRGTQHRVNLSDLEPGTRYYFQAVSWDEFGTEKRSEVISLVTKPDWEMSDLSGDASRHSANLKWETSYPTTGRILWGVSPGELVHSSPETATSQAHSLTVEGLPANTVVYFQAISRDSFGLEKRSQVIALRTLADWAIVGFSGEASRHSAELRWQTPDYITSGRLFFGLSPGALNEVVNSPEAGRDHRVELSGLAANTTYYFQAEGTDNLGSVKRSAVISLRTIADWSISGLKAEASERAVSVTFQTLGYPTAGKVMFGLSEEELGREVETEGDTVHTASLTDLAPDTVYYLQAVAQDDLGVERRSSVITVRTKAEVPPLPVWKITGFEGVGGQNAVTLQWRTEEHATSGKVLFGTDPENLSGSAASDGVRNNHEVVVSGLEPDTVYYFQVVAADDRDQEQSSAVISVRTQAVPLPVWEITSVASEATLNSVAISWKTETHDTIGKVRWGLAADALVNETGETSFGRAHGVSLGGLAADTLYFFQVVARDNRGQEKTSAVFSFRTQQPPQPVPEWRIQGFDGTTTATAATMIWQTQGAVTKAVLRIGLSAEDLSYRTVEVNDFKNVHLVTVEGLNPDTVYHFQVKAIDQSGASKESGVISKRTKP